MTRQRAIRCVVPWIALMFVVSCVVQTTLAEPKSKPAATCLLRIALVDDASGDPLPGLIQVTDPQGQHVRLPKLLDRGQGLPDDVAIHNWSVLTEPTTVPVAQQGITVKAFSGLETEFTTRSIDLVGRDQAELVIPLKRFFPARKNGWQAANTHVHLRGTTRPETDRYLVECARADGLDIVFVSYLERHQDDLDYSTNKYSRQDLAALSNGHTHFGHGEEHRHNFGAYDEGYGHVMLLNIPMLIHPVSIGPAISHKGTDGRPINTGIREAKEMGGHVIWCHNDWGLEDVPNWLLGHMDANNIFDGGTHGSYEHSFYRYLNVGIEAPFSTGTDWFMYDFSRVYVQHDGRMGVDDWLNKLSAGESYITNGPLLQFAVDDVGPGGVVARQQPGAVRISARAIGRIDFSNIELVHNGHVVQSAPSREVQGHYEADLNVSVELNEPGWLALRTPPPSAPNQGLVEKTPLNEYGRELFSHTSAVFVDIGGQRIFHHDAAQQLLEEMRRGRQLISEHGMFADDKELRRVLRVYDDAIDRFTKTVRERGSQ